MNPAVVLSSVIIISIIISIIIAVSGTPGNSAY